MLLLLAMLLMGLLAMVWGFIACFMPASFDRLTQAISFAGMWTVARPKRQLPVVRVFLRIGRCIGGLSIFAAGFWFAYMAASEIYKVQTGHGAIHTVPQPSVSLSNTSSPSLIVFSIIVIIVGALMAITPGKVIAVFDHIRQDGRSVRGSAVPAMKLFLRIFGVLLAFMATMSLLHLRT